MSDLTPNPEMDIVRVLTQQPDYKAAQNYWKVFKHRLNKEGSQLVANCNQLKTVGLRASQQVTNCHRLKISPNPRKLTPSP
jgi:DNA-damage-inducible protein D